MNLSEYGKKNKRKILFIHGWLGDNSTFKNYFPITKLQKKYHLIFLNLEIFENVHTFHDYANKTIELLKSKFQKVDLVVGYSMGGRLALHLKLKDITYFNKLILISSAINPPLLRSRRLKRFKKDKCLLKNINSRAKAKFFLNKWYNQEIFYNANQTYQIKEFINKFKLEDSKRHHYLISTLSVGLQPLISIKNIENSIFYLFGEKDLKYKNISSKLKCSKYEFKNCGHAPHIEEIEFFKEKIEKIINDFI